MTYGWASRVVGAALLAASMIGLGGCITIVANVAADRMGETPEEAADRATRERVDARLSVAGPSWFQNLRAVVYRGRVMLVGTAASEEVAAEAEKIASAIDGVAEVINEIQVVGPDGVVGSNYDVVIQTAIESKLREDTRIDHANYELSSINRVVYLMGRAASQAELDRVLGIARATANVRDVVHHVLVAPAA